MSMHAHGDITVANIYTHCVNDHPDALHVYCGRWRGNRVPRGWSTAFQLGNPFMVNAQCSREEAIAQFRLWLRAECRKAQSQAKHDVLELAALHHQGADLVLGCHCAPKPCHCDVIAEAIRGYAARM